MEQYENIIWEGRYQPFHYGHLLYVKELLKYDKHVWIFVVDNERSIDVGVESPVPHFTRIVDQHHQLDKNFIPFHIRLRIVQETIAAEFGPQAKVTVWGGRRLDLNWDYYKKALPDHRVFLTPLRDEFEDEKARAWAQLGEEVVRIDVGHLPRISATQVRAAMSDRKTILELLPAKTIEIMEQYDLLPKHS